MNNWRISSRGVDFIKGYEKCVLKAYRDQGGTWTIGWGHTGYGVFAGVAWTQMQADKMLVSDINVAVVAVNQSVTVPLTQAQFDALCSLTYNIGVDAFKNSTILRLMNNKEYIHAAEQFARWNKVKGVISNGLINRRAAEKILFLSELSWTPSSPQLPPSSQPSSSRSLWQRLLDFILSGFSTLR